MDITATARGHDHGHLVVFNVAPYGLCAPAAEVEGIVVVPHIRPLPQSPPSTIGVVQHRGQVYRVISLRRKLGLESGPPLLEGQLILTRLSCGLTAFLVDEVVDVRPAQDFVRQPLSPQSPMDFFDAFLLRDEQILLHTTFTQMEQARQILRLESDAFTLTVERPTAPLKEPNTPSVRRRMTTGSEITHRVVSGDTLWDIAAEYLGDPVQYPELARLSRIRNPDLIYPGDIVRIRRKPTLGRGGTHPAHP